MNYILSIFLSILSILSIFLGILLYFYFNLKEKLLIPFDITQMNRCKAYVCPTTPRPITAAFFDEFGRRGDCYQQCTLTYINMIDNLDMPSIRRIRKVMDDYMVQHDPPILGKPFIPLMGIDVGYSLNNIYNLNLFTESNVSELSSQERRELREIVLQRYENPMNNGIKSPELAFTNLKYLFSKLLPNSSRVLIFCKVTRLPNSQTLVDEPYAYHVVIIARTDHSIYMLDSKHRIIFVNSDIWNHPWLDINFGSYEQDVVPTSPVENFKWNLESSYVNNDLYFLPVVNVGSMLKAEFGGPDLSDPNSWSAAVKNDINPNFERDSIVISRLLREGSPQLSLFENEVYKEWIRRLPNGQITDPREFYASVCATNVRPLPPPLEHEPCDPISDARGRVCKPNQNCYHTYDMGEDSWKCQSDESHIDDNKLVGEYCSVHNDKCATRWWRWGTLECRVNDVGIGTCQ